MAKSKIFRLVAILLMMAGLATVPISAQAAPEFKVLAFYSGTWDQAHQAFVRDANKWFPQAAAQHNFSYTSTSDWNQLNTATLSRYDVVLFLDDSPKTSAQRSAFQQYMQNGGGWLGFHVAAYNDNPDAWSWYYRQFLGTGRFRHNTWEPTTATLRTENRTHPSLAGVPGTFTSSVSEWYSWTNDLRANPDINVLASVDPVSFPLGTKPGETWTSGYYPIVWTNKNFKMVYANFGHDAMDYPNDRPLSSTFASPDQNRLVINSLKWLANRASGQCLTVPGGSTADSVQLVQQTCTGATAQSFRATQR